MRIIVALLATLLCTVAQAEKKLVVHFTEPTEVMSTIMYLAGTEEYNWGEMKDYMKDVDAYFATMKEHEAVKMVKRIHNTGFCFDKPMAFALRLQPQDGHLVMKEGIVPDKEGYLDCWESKYESQMVKLVDDFYCKSRFHAFYTQHQSLYTKAEKALSVFADSIDEGWYDRFFGSQENSRFEVVVSLLNGAANYASTIHFTNGKSVYYATMGCCAPDSLGNPHYEEEAVFPVMLHERNHAYCNPLDLEFWNGMKKKATQVFEYHPKFYHKLAYGKPMYVMNETFVEASMINYLREHGKDYSELYLDYDINKRRYYLLPTLLEAFKAREQHRDKYPTMHHFMPELVKAINATEITPVNDEQSKKK